MHLYNKFSIPDSLDVCSCKTKQSDIKPLMVDKSLETDRDIALEFEMRLVEDAPNNNIDINIAIDPKQTSVLNERIQQQKRAADEADKVNKI